LGKPVASQRRVAPYTRFVRGELDQVEKAQRQLEGVRRRISELNARVERI